MGKRIEIESFENIPEYAGLNMNSAITIKDGYIWDGNRYGIWVGRIYEGGEICSAFNKDNKNNNTEIFDKLRNDIKLLEKNVTVHRDNMELTNAVDYYVPYRVKGHSSTRPTIIDSHVGSYSNVHYSIEYEILLVADEGYTRYITESFDTEGRYASSFLTKLVILRIYLKDGLKKEVMILKTERMEKK